jgi:hypothetical protein
MVYWTAAPMTAQGPRKGESSLPSMRYRLRPQPAHLVRGSSRRIMSLRFRPANIRVINRRVCFWAVLGPAVPKPCSKLTSGNVFPPEPPVEVRSMPERCSQSRVRSAAPKDGAPLTAVRRSGQTGITTGGSGGNTSRPWLKAKTKTKGRLPSIRRKAGLIQNTVKPGGA